MSDGSDRQDRAVRRRGYCAPNVAVGAVFLNGIFASMISRRGERRVALLVRDGRLIFDAGISSGACTIRKMQMVRSGRAGPWFSPSCRPAFPEDYVALDGSDRSTASHANRRQRDDAGEHRRKAHVHCHRPDEIHNSIGAWPRRIDGASLQLAHDQRCPSARAMASRAKPRRPMRSTVAMSSE